MSCCHRRTLGWCRLNGRSHRQTEGGGYFCPSQEKASFLTSGEGFSPVPRLIGLRLAIFDSDPTQLSSLVLAERREKNETHIAHTEIGTPTIVLTQYWHSIKLCLKNPEKLANVY